MNREHLSTETLLAIRDGEVGRHEDLQHLASCAVCQEAFDDTRWFALLAQLRREQTTTKHPGREELLAYRARALPTKRLAAIGAHLTGCRQCVVDYARQRQLDKQSDYASPSPEVLGRVMQKFRAKPGRQLGVLLIRRLAGELRAVFRPEPRHGAAAGMAITEMDVPPSKHPSSAAGRAEKLRRASRMLGGVADDTLSGEMLESPSMYRRADKQIRSRDSSGPQATSVDARPWRLELIPQHEGEQTHLDVTLLADDPTLHAAGKRIRLVPAEGRESSAELDHNGQATIACPPGRSRLVVELTPPLVIDVDFES